MGILDDAIRQHLDLKRRQGAEEDEIQRLEDEAFGPPSRPGEPDFPEPAPEGEAPPETGESLLAEETPAAPEAPAGEPAGGFYDHSGAEAGVADAGPETAEHEPPIESLDTVEHEPPIESLDTVEHPFEGATEDTGDAEALEAPATDEEPLAADEPLTGEEDEIELVEGEVEDHPDEEEDVLEETPEFLRDAPEDDELWFEQGEPKDFDF
jgi:hypothetical protein